MICSGDSVDHSSCGIEVLEACQQPGDLQELPELIGYSHTGLWLRADLASRRFIGLVVAAGLFGACGGANGPRSAIGPALSNNDYHITSMGTADDVLVIEIDARVEVEPLAVARTLIKPVHDRYPEVLVYLRWPDAPDRPAVRVRWTAKEGYAALVLD